MDGQVADRHRPVSEGRSSFYHMLLFQRFLNLQDLARLRVRLTLLETLLQTICRYSTASAFILEVRMPGLTMLPQEVACSPSCPSRDTPPLTSLSSCIRPKLITCWVYLLMALWPRSTAPLCFFTAGAHMDL